MSRMTRIAVLVSGGGTNLQALIDAEREGALHSGKIELVLSSSPSAYALTRAENAGIATAVVSKKLLGGSQEAFEAGILAEIEKHEIDGRMETSIRPLDDESRVDEIARILGGIEVTESQRTAAREMIEEKDSIA